VAGLSSAEAAPPLAPAVTKSGRAYQILRRAIVVGEIPEERALDEDELMARYQLGRTPLREALKRLQLEQFVIWPPHRTPYVRSIGVADLRWLYEARLMLEEPIAAAAAARATDAEIAGMESVCAEMDHALKTRAIYEAVELDHAFHLAIARSSHNRFLSEAVRNLNCGSLRLWYLAQSQLSTAATQGQHRAIVRALRNHDPKAAIEETRRHIRRSYERQLELHRLPPNTSGQEVWR
jgi:DNA-binding GntR family transcriptional regulator